MVFELHILDDEIIRTAVVTYFVSLNPLFCRGGGDLYPNTPGPTHLLAGGGVAEIEARRTLVDNLECDLGDVASKRYIVSSEGLDVVRNQAAQWVLGVRNDASSAIASMAKNEVRSVSAVDD